MLLMLISCAKVIKSIQIKIFTTQSVDATVAMAMPAEIITTDVYFDQ